MFIWSAFPPDPAARQPFTGAAILRLYACHYLLAVLAILPRTYILRLAFGPVILWQAWYCAVGLDFPAWTAKLLGRDHVGRLHHEHYGYVIAIIDIALRSLEWALAKEPLRKYEPPTEGHHAFVERPLSISNVLLDAFDLICNKRGIGWSWSRRPFPAPSTRSTSIASILARILVKFTVWDLCLYTVHHLRPSTNEPAGDTIFDPALGVLPRWASATLFTVCFGMLVYTSVDIYYHIASLVGRLVLLQPAWQWPLPSNRPWMSTSIADFWRFRWHQFPRHIFVVFGARPGAAMLGRPGALLGAFGVSAVMHDLGLWGLGRGTEFRTVGGFFVLMGVGVVLEHAFEGMTGRRVSGFWGWVWTMVWTLGWCTFTVDAWARRGMAATDPPPDWLRPGKLLIETIALPLWRFSDIYGHHLYR